MSQKTCQDTQKGGTTFSKNNCPALHKNTLFLPLFPDIFGGFVDILAHKLGVVNI